MSIGLLATILWSKFLLYLATAFPRKQIISTLPFPKMASDEPNPPTFPESVVILRDNETVESIRAKIKPTEDVWSEEHSTFLCEHTHFTENRWALLFAPGVYKDLEFEVGYYVQVAGLGKSPDDVIFEERGPYVPALNRHLHRNGSGLSLDTFWRAGENFAVHNKEGMLWAVSQASPLRRVHVTYDLYLHDKDAYASGGHLASAKIDGHTHFGGQQQYFSRNCQFSNGTSGGAWGLVFAGCTGETPDPTAGNATSASMTIVDDLRVQVEKPYIALDDDGVKFRLIVPKPSFHGSKEVTEDVRDFSRVRVAKSSDTTATIQQALRDGKDVVLSPGIYHLDQTLELQNDNQVILGLGLATLVAPLGSPCIRVAPKTYGTRIAGVMLEAPAVDPERRRDISNHWSLLDYGAEGVEDGGDASNPGAMHDVFVRVGGATTERRDWISVNTMIRIFSGNLIGDDLWLWRADHGALAENEKPNCPQVSSVYWQTEEGEFNVDTGIEVVGSDVRIYGLAVEHASGHQTIWKGERGAVYFYQCEFPYDVGHHFGETGNKYRGYLVDDSVQEHTLYSPGIYSNFRDTTVHVDTAIQHPDRPRIKIINPFTVHLDNNGLIKSVINGQGPPATIQGKPTRIVSAAAS